MQLMRESIRESFCDIKLLSVALTLWPAPDLSISSHSLAMVHLSFLDTLFPAHTLSSMLSGLERALGIGAVCIVLFSQRLMAAIR